MDSEYSFSIPRVPVPVPERRQLPTEQESQLDATNTGADARSLDGGTPEGGSASSSQPRRNVDFHGSSTALPYPIDNHDDRLLRGNSIRTRVSQAGGSAGSASAGQKDHPRPVRFQRSTWNAFWLRWNVLLSFTVVGVCSIVAIALLYYFSRKHQGLCTESEAHQYAWKYGPTAFLTILAALWQQIDYTCKSLEPWRNMAHGYSSEKETLTLDYISANSILVVIRALRKRQWAVAASSAGSVSFIVAVAFSTGLLALSPVTITTHNVSVPKTTRFSAENYDGSFLQAPIRTWFGTRKLGLPYELGVSQDTAYDLVDVNASWLHNSVVTAQVNAFVPKYECETATVHNITYFTKLDIGFLINTTSAWVRASFESKSCKVTQEFQYNPDPDTQVVPQRQLRADWFNYELVCDEGSIWENYDQGTADASNIHMMRVFDLRFEQLVEPTLNRSALAWPYVNITGWNAHVADASAIFCRPTYSIQPATLTIDTSLPAGQNVIATELRTGRTGRIASFTNGNLSDAFTSPLLIELEVDIPPLKAINDAMQQTDGAETFWMLMGLVNGGSSLEAFLNVASLRNTAETLFRGIAAEFANQQLSVSHDATVSGTLTHSQNRLEMKFVSTLVVGIALTLLVAFVAIIFCFKAQDVVPRDPASIATTAATLTSSSKLAHTFASLGHASNSDLEHTLYKSSYHSNMVAGVERRFNIERKETSFRTDVVFDPDFDRWRPFPISWWFTVSVTIYTCGLIAVMEVMNYLSHREQGIASIDVSFTWAHEFSTVIPAVAMIVASEAYRAIYANFSCFAPFSNLHRGGVTASRSLMMKTAGRIHFVNMVNGVLQRLPGLVLVSVAVFLGTFLSTLVAALYQIQQYNAGHPTTVTAIDQFNFGFRAGISETADTAALVFGLIEQQNASYPPFVYDELVFPGFSIPSHATSAYQNSSIVVDLAATRAALRCDFAPFDDLEISYYYPGFGSSAYGVLVNATLNLPEICHWSGRYALPLSPAIGLRNQYDASYGSAIVDMLWNWITNERQTNSTCYSIGFVFGFFQYQNTHRSNITLMNCYQDIETVNTTTTFLPSMRIDPSNPPIIHEHTRRTVESNMLYRLSGLWDSGIMDYHLKGIDNDPDSSGSFPAENDVPMEPFYQTVVYGPDGVPAHELSGFRNRERLFNATEHLYRRYMALLINNNMRQKLSTTTDSPLTYPGQVIDATALRLIQNPAPKIALQVLLAAILIFVAIAYIITPMRSVLPHNPCTVAGVMSLLAGSDLCTRAVIPEGAEFMTDKEFEKVFEGYVFSLGWFGGGEERGGDARYGIDIGRSEKTG
jgi:Protein of unknown function (DUF3433)